MLTMGISLLQGTPNLANLAVSPSNLRKTVQLRMMNGMASKTLHGWSRKRHLSIFRPPPPGVQPVLASPATLGASGAALPSAPADTEPRGA